MDTEEKEGLYKRIGKIDRSIERILAILESDPTIGEQGLVKTVKSIQHDLNELLVREELYKQKAITYGTVAATVVSIFLWIGKFFISKLF